MTKKELLAKMAEMTKRLDGATDKEAIEKIKAEILNIQKEITKLDIQDKSDEVPIGDSKIITKDSEKIRLFKTLAKAKGFEEKEINDFIKKNIATTSDVDLETKVKEGDIDTTVNPIAKSGIGNYFESMPSQSFTITDFLRTRNMTTGETSSITAGTTGKLSIPLTAKEIKGGYSWAVPADLGGIYSMIDKAKIALFEDIALTYDYLLIYGNTTKEGVRANADGLLVKIASGMKADLSTLNFTNIMSLRAKLGKYGVNQKDIVIVCNPTAYFELIGMDEFIDVSKYGQNATILTGEVGQIGQIKVLVNQEFDNLDATGSFDESTPANNSKGSFFMYNKKIIGGGQFGQILYRYIETKDFTNDLTALALMALGICSSLSDSGIAQGYNIG